MSKIKSSNENLEIEAGGTGHEVEFLSDTIHGDNVKAKFGNDDDLQIYHDENNSIINEQGDGDLLIYANNLALLSSNNSEYFLQAATNGAVSIRYDNSIKLATSSSGVDIIGTVTADALDITTSQFNKINSYFSGSYISGLKFSDLNGGIWYDAGTDDLTVSAGHANSKLILASGGSTALTLLSDQSATFSGSVSADGLTSSAVITAQEGRSNTAGTGQIVIAPDDTTISYALRIDQSDNKLNIDVNSGGTWAEALSVHAGGDISFYDDTGSAKFHWDAADERLGLGTSSPAATLHSVAGSGTTGLLVTGAASNNIASFYTSGGSAALTIDSDGKVTATGKVHVQTASSGATADAGADDLVVEGSGSTGISILSGASSNSSIYFGDSGTNWDGYIAYSQANRNMTLGAAAGARTIKIDSTGVEMSGNVGIGVTPESWTSDYTALQIGGGSSLFGHTTGGGDASNFLGQNIYHNSGWKYINANEASNLQQKNGAFYFNTAPSGTADSAISWTTAMTIDNSGNVGIGTSSPATAIQAWSSSANGLSIEDGAYPTLALQKTGGNAGWVTMMDNDLSLYSSSGGNLRLGVGSERMRIDSSGNVGIGVTPESWTTSASVMQIGEQAALSVWDGTGGQFDIGMNAKYNIGYKYITSNEASYYRQYNGKHSWHVAPSGTAGSAISWTTAMTIDNSGSLLVGTASKVASEKANITFDRTSEWGLVIANTSSTAPSNATMVEFKYAGSTTGYIGSNGTATSYNTSSDYRLKEDWQPIANASDRLMQLKPCNFAWKADGSRVDGFLAHEAAEVVPEAVSGEKDAMTTEEYEVSPAVYEDVVIPAVDEVLDEDGNVITEAQEERTEQNLVSEAVMGERDVPDYQGIDQSKLVPLLTAALQEALARIEALENK
jgi:hypothetical protein